MRVYHPPQFNVLCRIWHNAFPADLSTWTGFPPNRTPDVTTACQLYLPRDGMGRWHHAISDDVLSTVLKTGWQELRCPKGTPLRTVWGAGPSTSWAEVALVEVPSGSGRLYACVIAETKHVGFPNEYVVGILAQVKDNSRLGELAAGVALDGSLAGGLGAVSWDAGSSLDTVVVPGSPPVQLPAGSALSAVVTSGTGGGGGSSGGPDCAGATATSLGAVNNVTVSAGSEKWLKCDIVAGTYKVTIALASGNPTGAFLMFGACPVPGSWGSIATGGPVCASSALSTGTIYVKVNGPMSGSSAVTIVIATGTC